VTFLGVTGLSLIGALAVALLVRKPPNTQPEPAAKENALRQDVGSAPDPPDERDRTVD